MKQVFTFVIFMCLCLQSCNKEVVYSCDEIVNEWVHENLSDIRVMSRSEWNKLEEDLKMPVYRAFTHQQRMNFWNDRLSEILKLEWLDEEKAHIETLLDFINNNQYIFEGYGMMSDKEKNTFDLFFYEWKDKAKIDFDWSDSLLFSILASGNTMIDTKGTLLVTDNMLNSRSLKPTSVCICSTSSDWCETSYCEGVPCEETFLGCGTIFAFDCNGRCGGI